MPDAPATTVLSLPAYTALVKERCLFWCHRLPFAQVALLLEQMGGQRLLSADTIWRLVQSEAQRQDARVQEEIAKTAGLPDPNFAPLVSETALYDPAVAEFCVLTDGIGVKAQKPTRPRTGQFSPPKAEKRHETDVMLLPRPEGGWHFISEGMSACWSLVEAARSYLRRTFSEREHPLCVVALTDGARGIRQDLLALFGERVRVVLDWFHLAKRVYALLSMVAHGKQEREAWERVVLSHLWRGRVQEALAFLSTVTARNGKALSDLRVYLSKHAEEIIDYEARQAAGKWIGSGRMEKAVDQVIGSRQKDQGMSWTLGGSRALALLKVAELNALATTSA